MLPHDPMIVPTFFFFVPTFFRTTSGWEFGVRPSKFAACWWSLLEHDARLRTLTTLLEFAAVFTEVFKIR